MDNEDQNSPPSPSPLSGLRKLMFIAGLLFIGWIFISQSMHRPSFLLHPMPAAVKETPPSEAQPAPETAKEDDALKERISQLEAKVKTLEDVIAASKPTADAMPPTPIHATAPDDERLAHLEEALNEQSGRLQSLQAQMGEAQSGVARRMSAWAELEALKEAVASGEPFAQPLDRLAQAVADNAAAQPAIASLKPYAAQGIPTAEALQAGFETTVPNALAPTGNGLAQHFQSLIRIRKVGEKQAGGGDESIIARAEAKVSRHDIENACKELKGLSAPAAAAFAPWTKQAKDFLDARQALESLKAALAEDKPVHASPPQTANPE